MLNYFLPFFQFTVFINKKGTKNQKQPKSIYKYSVLLRVTVLKANKICD